MSSVLNNDLSIEANQSTIVEAIVRNALTLTAAPGQADAAEYQRLGHEILSMMRDRSQLLPSFWPADGDESESLKETLNGLAKLTPSLYFSVRFDPTTSVALELGATDPLKVAYSAKKNHTWLNRFSTVSPTDDYAEALGRQFYEYREVELEFAAKEGRVPAKMIVGYANAS
jgi:hypothetical protein